MRPLWRTNRAGVSGWVCGKNETKSTQNFQIFGVFGALLTNGSVKLIAKSPLPVRPWPLNRPKIGNPAPTPAPKLRQSQYPAPAFAPAPQPRPLVIPAPRPRTRTQPRTAARSGNRASCPAPDPEPEQNRADAQGGACNHAGNQFEKVIHVRSPKKRPCTSHWCRVKTACQRLQWSHATPQHCLGDNVVGWPLSYQGPRFQVAVTYGLPCPAVRDSRSWERRCIYCLIAGRLAPYCAASRTGGTHTGTPPGRLLGGLAGVGLYVHPAR